MVEDVSYALEEEPKKRYLLFDSGCSECTEIAQSVEKETEGWLSARSLQDRDVQKLLSETRPDWKWEPTLLEVDGQKPQVFTGLAMKTRMLVGLGPRRARRVAKIARRPRRTYRAELVEKSSGSTLELRPVDRREMLKMMVAFGAATLVPSTLLSKEASARSNNSTGKFTVKELNGERVRRIATRIRRDDEGNLLWNHLVREGFAPNVESGSGVLISPLTSTPKNTGKRTLLVEIPFYTQNGRRAKVSFKKVGGKLEIRAAIYSLTDDRHTASEATPLEVEGGQVTSRRPVEIPSTVSSEPQFTAQGACSRCQVIVGLITGLGCESLGILGCPIACTTVTFGAGLPICAVVCPLVFASACIYGTTLNVREECARYC